MHDLLCFHIQLLCKFTAFPAICHAFTQQSTILSATSEK
nr:MAG TPA: hypothetical protein [Caudoviricetes sp.]